MNTFPSLVCLFHCTGIVIVMFIITVFAIVANDDTETVVFTAFIRRSYYRCLELKIPFFKIQHQHSGLETLLVSGMGGP